MEPKVPTEESLKTWMNNNYGNIESEMAFEDIISFALEYVKEELEYYSEQRLEAGQVETLCYVPELRFKAVQLSTGEEIESDSISQKTICEKIHVFMKDPNRTDYGRVWTEVDPETVKQIS